MKNKKIKSESSQLNEAIKIFKPNPAKSTWEKASNYDWDWLGVIEYSYDSKTDPIKHSDCIEEGICRCATIANASVKSFDILNMVKHITDKVSNGVLVYCIDRIIRLAKISEDNFYLDIGRGYYGDEIKGAHLDEGTSNKIVENLSMLIGLSDVDKVKTVLTLEYGFLLEELEPMMNVSIKEINTANVSFQKDYGKKVNLSEDFYDKNFDLPRGVFIEKSNCFRLIDGYHRFMKAKSLGMKAVNGIVLS